MGSNEHILGDCLPPLHISSLDLGRYAPERGITLYTIRLDRESIPSLKRNVQATEIIEHEPRHEYSRCDYDLYTCTTLFWTKS